MLRTALNFAHIGALLGGGGAAIVEDRAMLKALRQEEKVRHERVQAQRLAHRVVMTGLTVAIGSGLLLFAADWETYLYSKVFWLKMILVVMLIANGVMLTQAEQAAVRREPFAWSRLRRGATGARYPSSR